MEKNSPLFIQQNPYYSAHTFYKLFKNAFSREPYLDHINCFHLRKVVSKFRCSDHRLEIETGRHRKLKVEERICQLCKENIETELHFLQECPLYRKLRTKYFGRAEITNGIHMLQCNDKLTAFNPLNPGHFELNLLYPWLRKYYDIY